MARNCLLLVLCLVFSGCAYHFGRGARALPKSYERIAIPVMSNLTKEVGIEVYFTNAIVEELDRSSVALVVSKDTAEVTLEGEIRELRLDHAVQVNELGQLPQNAVLTTEYRIRLETTLRLRRNSDRQVLWQGTVKGERSYAAPQVTRPVLNSVNALYNQSSKHLNIARLAEDMMAEAYDRMTENF